VIAAKMAGGHKTKGTIDDEDFDVEGDGVGFAKFAATANPTTAEIRAQ
jgi:hypothetical protein